MANPSSRRVWIILIAVIALIVIYAVSLNNSLIRKDERVKLTWGNLQSAYQRRLDLVPNLVNVVKATADFESTTLQQVTEARARATELTVSAAPSSYADFQGKEQAQGQVALATNRLLAVMERYPTLKGTQSFSTLQAQLEGTERRIRFSRNDFNKSIAEYNQSVKVFPAVLFAGILGYREREGFTAQAGAAGAPEIKF